jgi:hypothetical protein
MAQSHSYLSKIAKSVGITIEEEITVEGTGDISANILQFFGSVTISDQWAMITEITSMDNLTNMYADAWDGTNVVGLTADGAVLSGMPVDTVFTKDKVSSEIYTVNDASEVRLLETLEDRNIGRTFTLTNKYDTDTFIRLHLSTTDAALSFKMLVHFEYHPLNGSTLAFL